MQKIWYVSHRLFVSPPQIIYQNNNILIDDRLNYAQDKYIVVHNIVKKNNTEIMIIWMIVKKE